MGSVPGAAISKRRKFVADGVFFAELNEFFQRELAEEGYSGVEVRVTPTVTTSSSAQHTPKKFSESKVDESANLPPSSRSDSSSQRTPSTSTPLRAKTVVSPLSPNASPSDTSSSTVLPSAEHAMVSSDSSWRVVIRVARLSSLESCVPLVRRAKFTDGFMIHSGQPAKGFIDSATRHVLLRQGVLGIKVKIMRGSDPEGKSGPQKSLPDSVTIIEPKEEQSVVQPMSQDYGAKAAAAQAAAEAARATEQGEEAPAEEQ